MSKQNIYEQKPYFRSTKEAPAGQKYVEAGELISMMNENKTVNGRSFKDAIDLINKIEDAPRMIQVVQNDRLKKFSI